MGFYNLFYIASTYCNCNRTTHCSLQQQMHVVSPFVQAFKQMAQVVRESGIQENARLLIRAEETPDPRRYN